jgi:hypothetical protein
VNGPAAGPIRRRAFIIAIEKYEQLTGALAPELPGTHQGALDLRRWLIDEQGLTDGDIYFCTEQKDLEGRTAGATLEEIRDELKRLKVAGKDQTDELYFYFSGHGFCYTDRNAIRLADVLVAANYRDYDSGPSACLDIGSLQVWLQTCLGPRDHFYFIDCCRNRVTDSDVTVSPLGLGVDRSVIGSPTVYTLYSTVEGELAQVGSGFTGILLEGLKGVGRAKVWRGAEMAVMFDSVRAYVESKLAGQPVDQSKNGSRDGVIREIAPPPKYRCEVVVRGADETDEFKLKVRDSRGHEARGRSFKGPRCEFKEVPDDYNLTLTTTGHAVEPVDPLPADLYEDRTVRFEKRAEPKVESFAPPAVAANVTIVGPSAGSVQIRDLGTGHVLHQRGMFMADLSPGRHLLKVLDERNVRVSHRMIDVSPESPLVVDLSEVTHSPLRDSLLENTPIQQSGGAVDFSESLGPTPDQGMDLWLALIGAARIVSRWAGDFSKLRPLPLATLDNLPAGASPVYLLAGFDDEEEKFYAGVSPEPNLRPRKLAPNRDIPGLFELLDLQRSPGTHLLTLRVGDTAPLTLPIPTRRDRVSFVTVSREPRGDLRIQRFMLPTVHLRLPTSARNRPYEPVLGLVRRRVEMQREFASGRDLRGLVGADGLPEVLLSAHVEPIGALLGAYEMARRGRQAELKPLAGDLLEAARGLPDAAAIRKLAGMRWQTPSHPPMFLDGLLELDLMADRLPLPAGSLDFSGPWTLWLGCPPGRRAHRNALD